MPLAMRPLREESGALPAHVFGERLHSERDNIMSYDVTLGVRVIPSPKEKRRVQALSLMLFVVLHGRLLML